MAQEQRNWKLYRRSRETWEAMLRACEGARRSIDFEQYYFIDVADGLIGGRFLDVLKRKASEGVKVRMLIDATGSWELYRSDRISELERAGARIRFHKTIPRKHAGHFMRLFLRDHRRLIVVDDEVGFVGGTAIKEGAYLWRDTHAELRGPVVGYLAAAFQSVWSGESGARRFRITEPATSPDKFIVVPNGPRMRERHIHRYFIDAIRNAEKSVYITTPYFVPEHATFRALRLAARRGVDVRLLVPEVCDSMFMQFVNESFFDKALKAGIKIYFYSSSFLHAKTMTVDDDWATVGSCNFDQLSFRWNYELNVVGYDQKFVLELKDHFFDDLRDSIKVEPTEWKKRLFLRKLIEKLTYLARPFA